MNRAYQLVWNATQQAWVVAGELAKGRKKSSGKKLSGRALKLAVLLTAGVGAASVQAAPAVDALPTGEFVIGGSPLTFDRSVSNQLRISQAGPAGVIYWQDFNVGKDAKVVFTVPNASNYTFNTVYGGNVSEIFGQVQSNGHFLINNPSGVIFGAGSQVNASAIVASAVGGNAMPGNSNHYSLNALSGAAVQNYGTLTATNGSVTLLAAQVLNNGTISATGGNVNLLNAENVSFADSIPTINAASSVTGTIQSSGNITATKVANVGGKILLTGDTSQPGSSISFAGNMQADDSVSVEGKTLKVHHLNSTADTALAATDGIYMDGTVALATNKALALTSGIGDSGYYLTGAAKVNLSGAAAGFSVNGTAYTVIQDVNQLQAMKDNVSGYYVLGNDIDATATAGWNSGAGFIPVAQSTSVGSRFSGRLDGLGHVVDGLTINRPAETYVALIGGAGNATLQNIGLSNVSMTGNNHVAALVGYIQDDSINDSHSYRNLWSSGTVSSNSRAGGLIGSYLSFISSGDMRLTLDNLYSSVNVTGKERVGGLLGYFYAADFSGGAHIARTYASNLYATGNVSNTGSQTGTGGLIGYLTLSGLSEFNLDGAYASGTLTTSAASNNVGGLVGFKGQTGGVFSLNGIYWDADTTGQTRALGAVQTSGEETLFDSAVAVSGNGGVEPLAYAQGSYSGLDFSNDWFIAEGSSRPMLRSFLNTADSDGRIAVSNLYQLQGLAANLAGGYYLTSNIDATATAASVAAGNAADYADVWGGKGFAPIGNYTAAFTGTLDGAGYVVNGLSIGRADSDYVGLIGNAQGSTVQNIGLSNVSMDGRYRIGGLLGSNIGGTVRNSYASGSVHGNYMVGGLIGDNYGNALVTNSYASSNVRADNGAVGGLVGNNYYNSVINNSYASGSVTGDSNVGGLAGYNEGNTIILNSYASGTVTGNDYVGGLIGTNIQATAMNSYWNTTSTGQAGAVGAALGSNTLLRLVGLTAAESTQLASYANWSGSISAQGGSGSTWRIYEGQTAPLLRSFLTALTISANDDSKTYNAAAYTPAGGYHFSISPVNTSNILGSATYGGSAVGAVNAGSYNLSLAGLYSNQQGYDISFADGSLTVNKAALSITSSNVSKTYDATTSANASAVISSGTLFGTDSISGGSFAFADKNAGVGKTVTVSGVTVSDGNNGGNYDVTYVDNTTSTINKRLLTINAVADSKEYDGKLTSSTTAKPVVVGRQRGDAIVGLTQSYLNKNAGTGKTINVDAGYTIRDGNNGNNYDVVLVNSTAGVITPKALTISTVANSKVYDGGVTSANKPVVTGLISGDRVTGLFQQYETKTVGTGKKLLIKSGYVVNDGNGGGNYTVTEQGSNDGVITLH